VNATLTALDFEPLALETIVGFVGNGVERLVARSLERVAPQRVDALLGSAVADFGRRYAAHALDHTVLYPGIGEALRRLHSSGAAISLLTNKPRQPTLDILRGLGLQSLVGAISTGDDRFARKPSPAGLRHLIAAAGTEPRATLLVGDSLVDLETARAAEADFCAVAWGFTAPEVLRAAQPRFLIDDPLELDSLVPA
jgi:phosphoglycolate phosphatase